MMQSNSPIIPVTASAPSASQPTPPWVGRPAWVVTEDNLIVPITSDDSLDQPQSQTQSPAVEDEGRCYDLTSEADIFLDCCTTPVYNDTM